MTFSIKNTSPSAVSRQKTQKTKGIAGTVKRLSHLYFDDQVVNGDVELHDLLAHLLLALLQAGHHLVEAGHPVLQAAHLDQTINATTQRRTRVFKGGRFT